MITARPPARAFRRAVIVGVGLLGGSLGMALKNRRLADRVVGLVRRRVTIAPARNRGAVDEARLDPRAALAGADLVVFATPLARTPALIAELAGFIPPGALVTDVGSAKTAFLAELRRRLPAPAFAFASSHPMAGAEQGGVGAARADLFEGSRCLLIREAQTPGGALRRLRRLWRAVGCRRVVELAPKVHDRWVAHVSHLPHVVAAALSRVLADRARREPGMPAIAGGGLRDTTRIAAAPPELWVEILGANRRELLPAVAGLRRALAEFETRLRRGNDASLRAALKDAAAFRRALEVRFREHPSC